jgi:hypothetical protein
MLWFLLASFWLELLFDIKDGDSRFLQNVGETSTGIHGITSQKTVFFIFVFA